MQRFKDMSGNNGISINIDPIALLEWGRVQGAQQQELESRIVLLQQLYVAQQAGHSIPVAVQAYALGAAAGGLQINLPPMRDASVQQQNAGALPLAVELRSAAAPAADVAQQVVPADVKANVAEAEPQGRSGDAIAVILRYLLGTGVVMLLIAMVLGINLPKPKWLPQLEIGVGKANQAAPTVSPSPVSSPSPSTAVSPAELQGGVGISGRVDQYVQNAVVKP